MAIAFARIHYISRAKGHSAIAASAYRSGAKLQDERYGKVEDYRNHSQHVIYSEVRLPEGAHEQFKDRETLWNAVEAAEDRYNNHHKRAQVAVDCILALPNDLALTRDDLIEMTQRFADEHFVSKGVPVDINLHDNGKGNPHAHILRTTRRLMGDDFDPLKARDLNPEVRRGQVQVDVLQWEQWRNFQNDFFQQKGLDLSVDPNGIVSQLHLGKNIFHNPERENTTLWQQNESRKRESLKITLTSPSEILDKITQNRVLFTRADLAKLIDNELTKQGISDPAVFQNVMTKVEGSKLLIHLGPGADGKDYYTTQARYQAENDIQDFADYLKNQHRHVVSDKVIEGVIAKSTLSEEQCDAVRHVVSGQGISALLGRAGTGKSYTLGAARDMWVEAGYRVHGIALSGKAAANLEESSGISSRTIESFRYQLRSGRLTLSRNDVVVMDEAGMADSAQFREVLFAVAKAKAKFVYAGDPDQTLPVGPGAPMRALLERTGYAELNDIRRQKTAFMRQATKDLAAGRIDEALSSYQEQCLLTLCSSAPKDADLLQGHLYFYQEQGAYHAIFRVNDEVVRTKLSDLKAIAKLKALDLGDKAIELEPSARLVKAAHYRLHMGDSGSFIHFEKDDLATMTRLIHDWQHAVSRRGAQHCAIMAYTNAEVKTLNEYAREALIEKGQLNMGVRIQTAVGERRVAIGERIQLLKNNRQLGIVNGQFATIEQLARNKKGEVLGLEVRLDGNDSKTVMIDLSEYDNVDYGYAATVNKFQGQTVDESFSYVSGFGWNKYLGYTALSRHRESTRTYVNQENYADMAALTKAFSREAPKDSLYDWPWLFRERRGMPQSASIINRFQNHLAQKLKGKLNALRDDFEARFFPEKYWSRKQHQAAFKEKMENDKQRNLDAVKVYEYTEAAKSAGRVWAHVFDANEKNKARYGDDYQLGSHTEYREALECAATRDKHAFELFQDISRFEGALSHYQIDPVKLEKQARAHGGREAVKDYMSALSHSDEVKRDKLAYDIIQDFKVHAPGVGYYKEQLISLLSPKMKFEERAEGFDDSAIWKIFREQAQVHERKLILSRLNEEEKTRFERVGDYLSAYQKAAILWQQFFEEQKKALERDEEIDFSMAIKAQVASQQRNNMAGLIFENLDAHREGLNFYHIEKGGDVTHSYERFERGNKKFDPELIFAKRAVKLKKYAYQAYAKTRIEHYLDPTHTQDKSKLADIILKYPKQHNRIISTLAREAAQSVQTDKKNHESDANTRDKEIKRRYFEITQALKEDAIIIRRARLVKKLDEAGINDLNITEQYYLLSKAVRAAWACFFENGKTQADAKQANLLASKRDDYAVQILKEMGRFKAGITLYDIDPCELEKSLQAQACRDRVQQFLDPSMSRVKKQEVAAFMVENRGAHTAALGLVEVDWRVVYPYADVFAHQSAWERIERESDPSRINAFKLLSRYTRLNRRLARVISNKKKNKSTWTSEQQAHFDRLQAERQALGYQLLAQKDRDIELWDLFRLSSQKCQRDASIHAVTVAQLRAYCDERVRLLTRLKGLLQSQGSLDKLVQDKNDDFLNWRASWHALSQSGRGFLMKADRLSQALKVSLGLTAAIATSFARAFSRDLINSISICFLPRDSCTGCGKTNDSLVSIVERVS